MSTSTIEAHTAWMESNPLRSWRTSQKPRVSIIAAASMLGVSMTMVRLWEAGAHKPTPATMPKLTTLLGPDAERQWDQWWSAKPNQA